MNNITNEEIVKALYKNFGEGNMSAVMQAFDKDVVWLRSGAPDIPFSGTFTGIEGMTKMMTIIQQTIKLKHFIPQKFCSNEDTVVVLGHDEAEVISTGKTYHSDWVQSFTFRNSKIAHVQVYMDTLAIMKAIRP